MVTKKVALDTKEKHSFQQFTPSEIQKPPNIDKNSLPKNIILR